MIDQRDYAEEAYNRAELVREGMAEYAEQHAEAARWASLLIQTGEYFAELHGTGQDEPFNKEWRVFGPGWNGPQVATIDIDGCGASWHGTDELWLSVIGPSVGITK